MTIEDVDKIYCSLDAIFKRKFLIARGGYYALLKQNILKQSREIGDLDVNILRVASPSNSPNWRNVESMIGNFINEFRINKISDEYFIDIKFDSKKNNSYDTESDDEEEEDEEINESNSFLTAKFRLMPKLKNPSTDPAVTLRSGLTFSQWVNSTSYDLADWGKPIITVPSSGTITFNETGNYVDIKSTTVNEIEEPISPNLMLHREQIKVQSDLMNLMVTRCPSFKVDLFSLDISSNTNKVKIIGDELYTNPYVILSAKHRYCSNMAMAYPLFLKHVKDLEDSYQAIRIKGVNLPEDIFLLKENRGINDEQKNK